jgi:hypothetical protein
MNSAVVVSDRRIGLVNVVFVCKNMLCMRVVSAGVRESARGARELALSKGPEWMGNLPP